MYRHQYFDLRLHDDEELRLWVGGEILERVTLHEWPLSCVQRLTMADGRKLIYKTQYGPTVEAEFYASARSDLLPWGRTIYQADGHACLLIEFVDAPTLEDLHPSQEEAVRIGRDVLAEIATILPVTAGATADDLPHYIDVSDEGRWRTYVQGMLGELSGLIASGAFSVTTEGMVRDLERWAHSESVLSAIRTRPGYVHRDLSADNLLVLPDGCQVIDWQRPILGPRDLDMVDLLASLGYDPLCHIEVGVVQVWHLLSIGWITEAKARWYPQGTSYDRQVAELVQRLRKVSSV